ncbi:tetratricopeptide repeat protein [Azospirillum sp. A1-3]|uniref:tetratricopeptide repeat-containing glycosyltransferase family protein n=1 Tax=Azospirillum sp. A1-3 TaxID=185874 RepID=UPI0020772006|nr:tetratricopeptide repeat protein [Azospirillum sp. A1-3]MCM8738512.1 tetratricopeptide repeat protein [Azospirillum sp. A1-3]
MAEAAFPGIEDAFAQCFGQGLHHIDAERLQDAASSLRRAAALRPDHPAPWFVLGLTLRTLGQGTDALAPLRAALRLRPDDPDTLFHLAGLLMEQARATEAVPVLRRLVWLRPDHPEAAFMLGNALMAVEEPEQAEATYRVAVLLRPDSADTNNNLGGSVLAQCRPDDAVGSFRRAIRIAPACPEHHKNLGICQLTLGDFEEGARAYEWRTGQAVWRWSRDFPGTPVWDGGPLAGKTILVHFEQGLGDSFQFVRYLSVLKARGARTVFECQPVLKQVLASVPGIDVLVARGEPLPAFDCCVSLMSLPFRCGTTLRTIPGGVPYLRPDPERTLYWEQQITEHCRPGELRVGIQWRADGDNRSIPLEHFAPLARVPGVRLFSLQQGIGLDQLDRLGEGMGIVSLPGRRGGAEGFVDTAAIVTSLDLVVACDSVVANLAGAMGKPVFLALPWLADWRWMRLSDRTPWYPATRLFRMARRNDWDGTMTRIAEAMRARIAAGGQEEERRGA